MVVCEGGFVASTIASLMMNGVCCVWQMQEEEDRRDAIRQDIRVEYERQRVIERDLWAQRQRQQLEEQFNRGGDANSSMAENWYTDASSVHTDHRRRKLIADKMRLSSKSQPSDGEGRASNNNQASHSFGHTLVKKLASPLSRQPIKKRKIRVATSPRQKETCAFTDSPHCVTDLGLMECQDRPHTTTTKASSSSSPNSTWNDMSSLMDSAFADDEDDDDEQYGLMMIDDGGVEEITSLVDVPLR